MDQVTMEKRRVGLRQWATCLLKWASFFYTASPSHEDCVQERASQKRLIEES